MKCLFNFKEKFKIRQQKSAPELKKNGKSGNSPVVRGAKSSSFATGCSSSPRSIPDLYEEKAQNLRVFSFSELRNATNNFSRLLKIGEGGFGSVYKGFIKPGDGKGERIVVAIKMLNKDGLQGHKQWMSEVQFLGVVDHPNLVKLLGYCALDGERGIQRLLVYEFLPNKTLEDHLFKEAFPCLPWKLRLQIVLHTAEGLTYLHDGLEVQVMGTYGYAAPDYVETGHLTTKSDVWSFGVVLYEILTGRRSLESNRPQGEQKLLKWVKHFPADSKKFSKIIDPRLENQFSLSAARSVAKLADRCLSKYSKDRPTMSEVVESLKQAIEMSEAEEPSDALAEASATDSGGDDDDDDKKSSQPHGSELSRRRMAHLAKLRENANLVGRRRFMIMRQAGKP
ncbi:hypothetical protein ACLOJK_030403 [Asimina triloba]